MVSQNQDFRVEEEESLAEIRNLGYNFVLLIFASKVQQKWAICPFFFTEQNKSLIHIKYAFRLFIKTCELSRNFGSKFSYYRSS